VNHRESDFATGRSQLPFLDLSCRRQAPLLFSEILFTLLSSLAPVKISRWLAQVGVWAPAGAGCGVVLCPGSSGGINPKRTLSFGQDEKQRAHAKQLARFGS